MDAYISQSENALVNLKFVIEDILRKPIAAGKFKIRLHRSAKMRLSNLWSIKPELYDSSWRQVFPSRMPRKTRDQNLIVS
jgi:hypothetical protein